MFENETPAERRTRRQQEAVAHRRRSIDGMNPAHPTASVDSGTGILYITKVGERVAHTRPCDHESKVMAPGVCCAQCSNFNDTRPNEIVLTCRDRMVVLSKSGPPAKPSQAWLLIKGKG